MAAAGQMSLYSMTKPSRTTAHTLDLSNLGGQQTKVVWSTTVHSQQVACSTMSQCLQDDASS